MAFPVRASSQPIKLFTSWSYSRLSAYQKCPLSAKLSLLDKVPQPQSEPLKRGDLIHQLAAKYITKEHAKLAPELRLFKKLFADLRRQRDKAPETAEVESSWAFRKDWSETRYDDWKGCWLRIKVDVAYFTSPTELTVIDWKTGKFSPQFNLPDYVEQLELYATGALALYGAKRPELKVTPLLVYLDQAVVYPEGELVKTYTVADLPVLKKKWDAKVKPMFNDKTFAPRPNKFCYSCHFRKDNKADGGGQCKY